VNSGSPEESAVPADNINLNFIFFAISHVSVCSIYYSSVFVRVVPASSNREYEIVAIFLFYFPGCSFHL
jgi:hypothetical protein